MQMVFVLAKTRNCIVKGSSKPQIDLSEYKRWKDVQENVLKKTSRQENQTEERQEKENDFNVEIVERQNSESDSGQASFSESEEPQKSPLLTKHRNIGILKQNQNLLAIAASTHLMKSLTLNIPRELLFRKQV